MRSPCTYVLRTWYVTSMHMFVLKSVHQKLQTLSTEIIQQVLSPIQWFKQEHACLRNSVKPVDTCQRIRRRSPDAMPQAETLNGIQGGRKEGRKEGRKDIGCVDVVG